jgi:hypothetical protein
MEKNMQTFYKIRLKDNPDRYVKGSPSYLSTDKSGRIFQSMGKLRTFITLTLNIKRDISNWEIVEFGLHEKSVKGVHDVITSKKLVELLTR